MKQLTELSVFNLVASYLSAKGTSVGDHTIKLDLLNTIATEFEEIYDNALIDLSEDALKWATTEAQAPFTIIHPDGSDYIIVRVDDISHINDLMSVGLTIHIINDIIASKDSVDNKYK